MSGDRSRRITKLEDRRRKRIRVPNIAECREGETAEQAISRLRAHYGDAIPARHAVLIVPTWPTLDAFAAALKAQQTELIDWVRSQHPKEPAPC